MGRVGDDLSENLFADEGLLGAVDGSYLSSEDGVDFQVVSVRIRSAGGEVSVPGR